MQEHGRVRVARARQGRRVLSRHANALECTDGANGYGFVRSRDMHAAYESPVPQLGYLLLDRNYP